MQYKGRIGSQFEIDSSSAKLLKDNEIVEVVLHVAKTGLTVRDDAEVISMKVVATRISEAKQSSGIAAVLGEILERK